MTKIILQSVVLRSFVPLLVLEAQKILKFNSTEQFLDNYLASSQASSMPSRTAHSVYRYSNNLDFLSVNFNIVKEFPGFICNVVYRVFINVKS